MSFLDRIFDELETPDFQSHLTPMLKAHYDDLELLRKKKNEGSNIFNPTINMFDSGMVYRIMNRDLFYYLTAVELQEVFSFNPFSNDIMKISNRTFLKILKTVFGVNSSSKYEKIAFQRSKDGFESNGIDQQGRIRDFTYFSYERIKNHIKMSESEFVRNIKILHGLSIRTKKEDAMEIHRRKGNEVWKKYLMEKKRLICHMYSNYLVHLSNKIDRMLSMFAIKNKHRGVDQPNTPMGIDMGQENGLSSGLLPERKVNSIISSKSSGSRDLNLKGTSSRTTGSPEVNIEGTRRNRSSTSRSSLSISNSITSISHPKLGRPRTSLRYYRQKKKKKKPKHTHFAANAKKAREKRKKLSEKKPKIPSFGLDGDYWKLKPQTNIQVIECKRHYDDLLSYVCCHLCHGEVKFKGNFVVDGSQSSARFGCQTIGCPHKEFGVLSCGKIRIPGGKKPVPLSNVLECVASLLSGIGPLQARKFVGFTGANPSCPDSFGRIRKLLGEAILEFCKKNEDKYLGKERELTVKLCGNEHGLYIIIDGTYGTRGSGKSYKSITAAVPAVGNYTGKVIAHGFASKKCITCERAKKRGVKPKPHKCYRNYDPKLSSKGMECKLNIDVIDNLNERMAKAGSSMRVKHVGGDQDSTWLAKIRMERPDLASQITKHHGISHFLKNMFGWLENLKNELYSDPRIPNHKKILTRNHRFKIVNVYMLAIMKKHRGDAEGMSKAVDTMFNHMFQDHKDCGDWCDKDASEDVERHIKYGGKQLFDDLHKYIGNRIKGDINQIASWAYDNWGEAVQGSIHAKHSKRTSSGGSGSFSYEAACGLLNYNEGSKYVRPFLRKINIDENSINHRFINSTIRKEEYDKGLKKTKKCKSTRAVARNEIVKSLHGVLKKSKNVVDVGDYNRASGYGIGEQVQVDEAHEPVSAIFEMKKNLSFDSQKENEDVKLIEEDERLTDEETSALQKTIILDFETTSIVKTRAVPVELSYKTLSGNQIYDGLMNPFGPGNVDLRKKKEQTEYKSSQQVHRISEANLRKSPMVIDTFRDLDNDLSKLGEPDDMIFSAWNFDYDKTVFQRMMTKANPNSELLKVKWFDGMKLVPNSISKAGSKKLIDVYNVSKGNDKDHVPELAHKSFFDVEMMGDVINTENPNKKKLAQKIINIKKRFVRRKSSKNLALKFCSCKGDCSNCSCSKMGISCLDNCKCNSEKCKNRVSISQGRKRSRRRKENKRKKRKPKKKKKKVITRKKNNNSNIEIPSPPLTSSEVGNQQRLEEDKNEVSMDTNIMEKVYSENERSKRIKERKKRKEEQEKRKKREKIEAERFSNLSAEDQVSEIMESIDGESKQQEIDSLFTRINRNEKILKKKRSDAQNEILSNLRPRKRRKLDNNGEEPIYDNTPISGLDNLNKDIFDHL